MDITQLADSVFCSFKTFCQKEVTRQVSKIAGGETKTLARRLELAERDVAFLRAQLKKMDQLEERLRFLERLR
jgi:hypothetical protein